MRYMVVSMDHFRHVFIGGSTPSDGSNHQASGVGPSLSKYRHQWTKVQDKKLVDILLWNLYNETIEANKIKDVIFQQDSRFKRFRWPQHLSWDDLHESFGNNHATGHFASGFEEPGQEWNVEGWENEDGATFTMETPQSKEPACGSGGKFAILGSSGTPVGGSSSNLQVPCHDGRPSPSSFEHRRRQAVRKRPQTPMQEFATIAKIYLGQPGTVSFTHTHTHRQDWVEDYRALLALLDSMGMTDAETTVAMCYFNKNPHVASAFIASNDRMRAIMLNGINQGL